MVDRERPGEHAAGDASASPALIHIFDGHNDLPWQRRIAHGYRVEGLDAETEQTFQTDIPKLVRGGLAAQFWSVFVDTDIRGADAVQATLEQIDFVHRLAARYPEVFALARTAEDVSRAWESGRIASLMGAEGGHQINDSLAVLRIFARLGMRYMTLTWNEHTEWADCAVLPPKHHGLNSRGREVVAEMNRIGMLVDLSHVSAETMSDALDVSTLPVIFSHSSCLALGRHPRDVPDTILRRLGDNGGVVMITFVPQFISPQFNAWFLSDQSEPAPPVTVADIADHCDHAREVAGIDHIGIGGDFDGTPYMPAGLTDVSGYPNLIDALRGRGWSDADLRKLGHENILRALAANDSAYCAFLAGAGK